MSFILDALKKSDQERKRGKAPQLDSPSLNTLPSRAKRPLWPVLVGVALALNAGLLVWWLRPWQTTSQTTVTAPSSSNEVSGPAEAQRRTQENALPQPQAKPSMTSDQNAPAGDRERSHPAARDQRLLPRTALDARPGGRPMPAVGGILPPKGDPRKSASIPEDASKQGPPGRPSARPGMEQSSDKVTTPERPPSPEKSSPVEAPSRGFPRSRVQGESDFKQLRNTISTHLGEEIQRVENSVDSGAQVQDSARTASTAPRSAERAQPQAAGTGTRPDAPAPSGSAVPEELPASLKSEAPKLTFSGFVYSSSKADRMVIINGKVRREGDEIQSDLKLEEITRDGIVMSYKGQRFKRKM